MKFEIEISEEEIRDAIEKHAITTINNLVSGYMIGERIKEIIKQRWQADLDRLVAEAINDSGRLREKIHESLVSRLKSKLTIALKQQEQLMQARED